MRIIKLLGLDDLKAAATVLGSVVFLILLLLWLPAHLRQSSNKQFAHAPILYAMGRVAMVTISPTSIGGGDIFNAIDVTYAGKEQYYAIPQGSSWKPVDGQVVKVVYEQSDDGKSRRILSATPIQAANGSK